MLTQKSVQLAIEDSYETCNLEVPQVEDSNTKSFPSEHTIKRHILNIQAQRPTSEWSFSKLYSWFLPLLVSIVNRYCFNRNDFYEAMGNLKTTFYDTILRFDISKGTKFSTYAFSALRFEVIRTSSYELSNNGGVVVPREIKKLASAVKELNERGVTDFDTIANHLNNAEIEDIIDATAILEGRFNMLHFEEPKNDEDDWNLYHTVAFEEPAFSDNIKTNEELCAEDLLIKKRINKIFSEAGLSKLQAQRFYEHTILGVEETVLAREQGVSRQAISQSVKSAEKALNDFRLTLVERDVSKGR